MTHGLCVWRAIRYMSCYIDGFRLTSGTSSHVILYLQGYKFSTRGDAVNCSHFCPRRAVLYVECQSSSRALIFPDYFQYKCFSLYTGNSSFQTSRVESRNCEVGLSVTPSHNTAHRRQAMGANNTVTIHLVYRSVREQVETRSFQVLILIVSS